MSLQRPSADWEAWQQDWRAGGEPDPALLAGLRGEVRRQSRRLLWSAVADGLLGLALLVLAAEVARREPTPPVLVWAAAVWAFTLVACGFSFLNRRGVWRPAAEDPRSHLELERRRQQRKLRTVRFSRWLLAAELAFVAAWLAWRPHAGPPDVPAPAHRTGLAVLLIGVFSVGILVWTAWTRRRALRQLQTLDRMARALDGEER